MHLLYCDESNFTRRGGDFFVYGGVVIDGATAAELAAQIDRLRRERGVPPEHILKFNPGPQAFTHAQFVELKQSLMEVAVRFEVRLLINLLLHDIATSSEEARRFGINTVLFHFDCLLNRRNDHGIVLIDRFDDRQIDAQLRERLAVGLTGQLPYSRTLRIERILGHHYAAAGQSHFCSLVDVFLGSLRFSINAFTQGIEVHMNSAMQILRQVAPLFVRAPTGQVDQISLWFSPREIRSEHYRQRYHAVRDFLSANSIQAQQAL